MRRFLGLLKRRWVETFLIIAGLVSLSFVTYDLIEEGNRQDCQAKINQQFFEVSRQRSDIASADREALARAISALLEATKPGQSREILQQYLDDKAQRDAAIKELPLPTTESARC